MSESITNVNLLQQSISDYTDYAAYVARRRAVPDGIDGLKPVARYSIWCAAHDFGGQGFSKTAAIVGQVIRKYSPHGDASVNDAIRNMINDFSTKYPTMEGDGSWGTKVDPYAAQPRYNEAKLSNFAYDVFIRDIKEDKRATDWAPNYDNKFMVPVYLPARIPILLINGQMGIAVGLKSSVPSHNLGDVIDATIALMHNPNAKIRLIPDECMPCEIVDSDWDKINETGIGNYIVRGIIETSEYEGKPCLIVRSLPDFTFFDKIELNIKALVKMGKMPYIIDMISRSSVDPKNTNKYIFEELIILKKGTDPEFVKNWLYQTTAIQQTRQVKNLMLINNKLEIMGFKQYLLFFIEFRRMSLFRRFNVRLQVLRTKIHERELYIKLLTSGHIQKVIDMIRKNKSDDREELIQFLIKKLRVTPIQARYLSRVTIPELSAGFLAKCQNEIKKFTDEVKYIVDVITDKEKIDEIIINEMLEIKAKYNNKKICKLISQNEALGIAPGIFKLVFMKNNKIKKINENDTLPPSKLPMVNFSIIAENTDDIVIFSVLGKAFRIPVSKIQLSDNSSDGTDIRILNKYCTTDIVCAVSASLVENLTKSKHKQFIFVITKLGFIKKMDIEDVIAANNSGLIYSRVDNDDCVKSILFGSNKTDLLIYSKNKIVRLNPKEVPYLRRSTKGNRASTSSSIIDGMSFLPSNSTDIIVVTRMGFVNKIPVNIVNRVSRGKAGIKVINLKKDDSIANVWGCTDTNVLVVRESRSPKEIPIASIASGSTISEGVQLAPDYSKIFIK